jgi:hypothetical protein
MSEATSLSFGDALQIFQAGLEMLTHNPIHTYEYTHHLQDVNMRPGEIPRNDGCVPSRFEREHIKVPGSKRFHKIDGDGNLLIPHRFRNQHPSRAELAAAAPFRDGSRAGGGSLPVVSCG